MFTSCLEVVCKIEGALSLKDKRMIVKSIKDKMRSHFNVSIAETGAQDKWQLGVLGMAFASDTEGGARKEAENALDYIREMYDVEVMEYTLNIY